MSTNTDEIRSRIKQIIANVAGPNAGRIGDDDTLRERFLNFLRTIEREPAMLAATGHLLTVGRKT